MYLLHPRTVSQMKLQLQMGSWLKAHPYQWRMGNIETTTTFAENPLWLLNIICACLNTAFIYYRLFQVLTSEEEFSSLRLAIHVSWLGGHTLPVAAHIAFCHRRREMAEFVNSFLNFMRNLESGPEDVDGRERRLDVVEILLQSFPIIPWFNSLCNFFAVIFFSSSPQFLTSLLEPGLRDSIFIRIIFASIEYYLSICIWKQYFFGAGFMIIYFKISASVLETNRQVIQGIM